MYNIKKIVETDNQAGCLKLDIQHNNSQYEGRETHQSVVERIVLVQYVDTPWPVKYVSLSTVGGRTQKAKACLRCLPIADIMVRNATCKQLRALLDEGEIT